MIKSVRHLFLVIIMMSFTSAFSAVTKVKYFLKYDQFADKFHAHIVITEGSASTISERVQFGSQYTLVVPAGSSVLFTDHYFPLKLGGNGQPTIFPCEWYIANSIFAPPIQPQSDFHGITNPTVPACVYNVLNLNDTVRIFSFRVTPPSGICKSTVRLYENGVDPNGSQLGGGDFSNGCPIGGPIQDYFGNVPAPPTADLVSISANAGSGSLRHAIGCAQDGATIVFADSLSNQTINLLTSIDVTKSIYFKQTAAKLIKIKSPVNGNVFTLFSNKFLDAEYIHIISSQTNATNTGRAIQNNGNLYLRNVKIIDPLLPITSGSTIKNNGQITILANSQISKI